MNPLVGGEVKGTFSQPLGFGLALPHAKTDQASGQDLADLGEALGGGHQIGVEGVGQGRAMTDVSGDYIPDGGENRRNLRAGGVSLSDEDRRLGLKSAAEAEEQEAAT